MKIVDDTPIRRLSEDWGNPDGTGMKAKSLRQVEIFLKNKFINLGYTFLGIANPRTLPEVLDAEGKYFYIAVVPGIYSNFGFKEYEGSYSVYFYADGSWSKQSLGIPFFNITTELGYSNDNIITQNGVTKAIDKLKLPHVAGIIDERTQVVLSSSFTDTDTSRDVYLLTNSNISSKFYLFAYKINNEYVVPDLNCAENIRKYND